MGSQVSENSTSTTGGGTQPQGLARRRVMLFTDSFEHGGTERQFVTTLQLLDPQRFDVRVGCLKRRGPFLAQAESLGLPIHEFPIRSLYGSRTFALCWRLIRLLREEKIELVHTFDFYTNVFAGVAARLAGVPALLISRREMGDGRSKLQRLAIRACAFLADGVVANSRAAGTWLTGRAAKVPGRLAIVPNCTDGALFHPNAIPQQAAQELGLPNASLRIGILAVLRPEKDVATFLRAATLVAHEVDSVQFVVIGDGQERDRLQKLASELGLGGQVTFLGDRSDIPELLAALDIVVLCSVTTESFPNAILEAMAAARPVVATPVGGVPEVVIHGETGWLVPLRDPQAMARRLIELAKSPSLRRAMGQAGRARAVQEFNRTHVKESLEKYYDEVLARRVSIAPRPQMGEGHA